MKNTRVTMRHIAEKAGVTHATVSLSLANNPRIPEATRERVKALAKKLGYQPHPFLSTLMRVRSKGRPLRHRPVIAVVCAYDQPDGWRNSRGVTIRQMREGAIERASTRGYRAEEFWLHQDGMTNARFSEMLRARGINGVLIGPLSNGAPPPELKWEYFSAVSLSAPLPSLSITTVCNDHYFATLQTVRHCQRLGYRRPGLVLLRSQHRRFDGRWEGGFFVAQYSLTGLSLTRPLVVEDDWNDPLVFRKWLQKERPDVVVSSIGQRVHDLLHEIGLKTPEDIGLANLSCPERCHPISGIFQNGHMAGATAMDTLISMIERNEKGLPEQAITLMVEGVWNPGSTLREAHGRS